MYEKFTPLFLLINNLLAQSYSVKINLFDAETNKVVESANAELSDKFIAAGSSSGEIIFDKIPAGKYKLIISGLGYEIYDEEIIISSDVSLVIQLNPIKFNLSEVIVTSSKYDKDIKQIPYAVSIVDESYIKKILL